MRKIYLSILLILIVWAPLGAVAQPRCDIAGRVFVAGTERPIAQAVVELPDAGLWAVADGEGHFTLKGVPRGRTRFAVSCLGYVTTVLEVEVRPGGAIILYAPEDNLKLESVVVTARAQPDAMATARTIDRNAIDHLQMVDASNIAALLPGGKTVNPDLTVSSPFSLRDGGSKAGNALFGTAVEIDGVRLSTNGQMGEASGAATRNIASTAIESVEVVTGVPSAEYGDISSGVVKISTRKGKTPYTITLATNPRTKQVSASKGFDLGGERGVLNAHAEYTRATKNPASPYTSYSRTGLSLHFRNTFARHLRLDAGLSATLGGMNSEDDPDEQVGEWEKVRDNALRANAALKWQLNRKWITSVDFDASINYADNLARTHTFHQSAVESASVHAAEAGYYVAATLPVTYYTTQNHDSRELDYAANVKATWVRSWGGVRSHAKIGVAWRADGNVGRGEFYDDPALAPTGFRPRPYTDIPYMHNLAGYIEETLTLPLGSTQLQLMAGLRAERTFIAGTRYRNTSNLSPRLNLKYRISEAFTIRAGWGLTEKLPSLGILYPRPMYRDTPVFSQSTGGGRNVFVYHTQPYQIVYNPDLRWQRNRNAEVGVDLRLGGVGLSLVGFFNRTKFPYETSTQYDPFSYAVSSLPAAKPDGEAFRMPQNPMVKVDSHTGEVFIRDADNPSEGWIAMEQGSRSTFVKNTVQRNGSSVDRMGLELVADFPVIEPIRTQFRLDGAYTFMEYLNEGEAAYYPATTLGGAFYPYVGIYADNGGNSVATYNGLRTHRLDMNLTATTRLTSIRMIVSIRLEASLVRRSQRLSEWQGREYAFNVDEERNPTGGSIYDGGSYTAIWPVAYLDLDGMRHPFTERERSDDAFRALLLRSGNAFSYDADGYDPYFSANISVTKEIGDHVSVSFYANNFTYSRPFVRSWATGVRAVFTPDFYYGLTVRVKF